MIDVVEIEQIGIAWKKNLLPDYLSCKLKQNDVHKYQAYIDEHWFPCLFSLFLSQDIGVPCFESKVF